MQVAPAPTAGCPIGQTTSEQGPTTPHPHSAINYERFNSNNVSIRYWSWNYLGCLDQTCPPVDTHCWVWIRIHCEHHQLKRLTVLPFLVAASSCLC